MKSARVLVEWFFGNKCGLALRCISIYIGNVPSARVVNIQDLIYTTNYVSESVSVREVKIWFQTQPNVRSLAVLKADGSYGIITRESLTASLLESVQNSHFLEQSASSIMNPAPYVAKADMPIQELLETVITLRGQEEKFFEDIVVCDETHSFLGLVCIRDVIVDQFASLMHRLTAMEAQQSALARQNKELFENSFRQGQRETQFRAYFDQTPLPIVIFDRDGKCLAANQRFYRLGNYNPRQLESQTRFEKIFANHFSEVVNSAKSDDSESPIYTELTLIPFENPAISVQALVEVSSSWGHIFISITSLAGQVGQTAFVSDDMITATSSSSKPAGKITQAIQNKLRARNSSELGRSVATNLIDREEHVERLMKKLEQIFSVAGQMEKHKASEPTTTEEIVDEREHLRGNIAEFSVIDLCQIIIQGTKTGQLLVFAHSKDDLTAYIYFYCGSIVHAKHRDGFEGEDALSRIVATKTGTFDFIFNKATPKTTIQGDPMGLLMNACRKADEAGV